MIKMVMFDLDGTLYSYDHCNQVAERRLKEVISARWSVSVQEAGAMLDISKREVKEQLGNVAASHNRLLYIQRICEMKGENPLLTAMDFYEVYWGTMLEEMKLFSYVIPLFQLLKRRNIRIGILTDLTAHIQYRKIDRLKIGDYIDYFTSSEEAGEDKPSQRIFQKMLIKTPFQPEEVLMVGDSQSRDINGAVCQVMKAVLYNGQADMIKEVEMFL